MEKKITKKVVLEAIRSAAENGADFGDVVSADDVISYVDTTIAQLNAKAEKAKVKAAEKKADGDELRNRIEAILTDDFQSVNDITAKLDDEEISKSKVVARLTQLVKAGKAHKEQIKDANDHKVMAYAIGAEVIDTED